ncbi:helix-turn-helix transcriptional regulator [Micromonospora sonneratiae]|uniref:Scr1 family TA system antitoxin-like transcriptional regulator n=1 Tax=Micromonospora sonneratiae TaxID=1184706 RepID=A0ABW3YCF3_9ACTN
MSEKRTPERGTSNATSSDFLRFELRHARQRAELTQEEQGRRMGYSSSLVAAVEAGTRRPPHGYLPKADEALGTGGLLARLAEQLQAAANLPPLWVQDWVVHEQAARMLRWFELALVPGLLQVEGYARAIFGVNPRVSAEQREARVARRLARQGVLTSDDPPYLWVVLDDNVLRRGVGGRKVMHDQVLHLANLATNAPRVKIQIVPPGIEEYPGLEGPLVIATSSHGDDVAFLDNRRKGEFTDHPDDLLAARNDWESIVGEALTPAQSIEHLLGAAETWT